MQEQKRNQNIPKLRFGEFSGEWVEKKLGEVATFLKGKNISKANIVENGKIECIRYGELYTEYKEVINLIKSKTNLKLSDLVLSKANDVIIPASGESRIDIATSSCVVNSGVALGGDLNIIRSSSNGIYLSYYLNSKKKRDISNVAQGVSVVHLYSSQISNLTINLPTLSEQQKIANFLTCVDKRIEKLEEKKSLIENYKKGIMQQIFNQKIRFKDNNGNNYPDWEEKKLGDVCNIKKGEQLNKEYLVEFDLYPALNGGIKPSGYTNKYNTNENTVTISEGGNSCGYINFMKNKFWSGGHCYSLKNITKNINNLFLYQILKFNENKIMRLRVGSGLPNIQKKDLDFFKLNLPTLPEQQKIANFLTAIDNKIQNIQTQIEQSKAFKKGLLQQMFI